jgi:hypothetical protein
MTAQISRIAPEPPNPALNPDSLDARLFDLLSGFESLAALLRDAGHDLAADVLGMACAGAQAEAARLCSAVSSGVGSIVIEDRGARLQGPDGGCHVR